MATKTIKTRIVNKHARANVWEATDNFIPLEGELIVFDKDDSIPYPRMKMGNGSDTVKDLPFISAGIADKLAKKIKISLNGDVKGTVDFDGSADISILTTQSGYTATYNGKPVRHAHTFVGDELTVSIPYTPSGSVSTTIKPKGSVSAPAITTTPSVKQTTVVTSAGSSATYTQGQCTFPTLKGNINGDALTLTVSGGSYTPGVYTPGSGAVSTTITYLDDVSVSASAPTFTGTEETVEGAYSGNATTLTTTITPSGTINETEVTSQGTVSLQKDS